MASAATSSGPYGTRGLMLFGCISLTPTLMTTLPSSNSPMVDDRSKPAHSARRTSAAGRRPAARAGQIASSQHTSKVPGTTSKSASSASGPT